MRYLPLPSSRPNTVHNGTRGQSRSVRIGCLCRSKAERVYHKTVKASITYFRRTDVRVFQWCDPPDFVSGELNFLISTIMTGMDLSERFKDALWWATDLHSNQRRKGSGIPYIAHLLGVTSLVLEYGGNEEEAIAALLHDAVEDQGGKGTRQLIAEKYGETIAKIVDGCTDSDTFPKPPWRERKEAYIAHIAAASPSVLLVSACDKLYNARSILADYRTMGDEIWERFKGGKKDGTLWYYQALVTEYKKTGSHPVFDELDRTVRELIDLVQTS